jgi:outer membrane immunogenic protein
MKYSLLAGTGVLTVALASTPALSADIPTRPIAKAPPAVASLFNWTGFYAGGHVGWGRGDNEWFAPSTGYQFSWDFDGVFGGGHVGYNYQAGSLVAGIQAEINASGIDGSDVDPGGPLVFRTKFKAFGSVDARLGVAFDRTLAYVIGGYAAAKIRRTLTTTGQFADFSGTHDGWNLGAGVEYAYGTNWTTRIEYRYYDFGEDSFPSTGGFLPHRYDLTMHTVRIGASYKF